MYYSQTQQNFQHIIVCIVVCILCVLLLMSPLKNSGFCFKSFDLPKDNEKVINESSGSGSSDLGHSESLAKDIAIQHKDSYYLYLKNIDSKMDNSFPQHVRTVDFWLNCNDTF